MLVFNRESGTAGMLFQHRKQGNGLDGAASVCLEEEKQTVSRIGKFGMDAQQTYKYSDIGIKC